MGRQEPPRIVRERRGGAEMEGRTEVGEETAEAVFVLSAPRIFIWGAAG